MEIDFLFVCTEGWEKMTPTSKGAFCHVCEKEVLDFTNKKNEEIKKKLTANSTVGEVCARLKPTQVLSLNWDSFFKKFTLWNLRKRIALVFFFVLGGMLFSCSSIELGKADIPLAGAVPYNDSIIHPKIDSMQINGNKTPPSSKQEK